MRYVCHIRCPHCSLRPGTLGILKVPRFKGNLGRILAQASACTRILVVVRGAVQGGAEEESIGFQVCSSGCSIDTSVLGLLGHLFITASAKPVLQTHIRACQIFKVKAGPRIPDLPSYLQASVFGRLDFCLQFLQML